MAKERDFREHGAGEGRIDCARDRLRRGQQGFPEGRAGSRPEGRPGARGANGRARGTPRGATARTSTRRPSPRARTSTPSSSPTTIGACRSWRRPRVRGVPGRHVPPAPRRLADRAARPQLRGTRSRFRATAASTSRTACSSTRSSRATRTRPSRAFVGDYEGRFHRPPLAVDAVAYDAARLLGAAIADGAGTRSKLLASFGSAKIGWLVVGGAAFGADRPSIAS